MGPRPGGSASEEAGLHCPRGSLGHPCLGDRGPGGLLKQQLVRSERPGTFAGPGVWEPGGVWVRVLGIHRLEVRSEARASARAGDPPQGADSKVSSLHSRTSDAVSQRSSVHGIGLRAFGAQRTGTSIPLYNLFAHCF